MMVHYELFRTFDRGIGQAAFACVLRFFREKTSTHLWFSRYQLVYHTDFRRSAHSIFLFLVFILILILCVLGVETHLEHAKADSQRYPPTSNSTTIPLSNNRKRGSGPHALRFWRWGIPDIVLRIKARVVLSYQRLEQRLWSWGTVIPGGTCIFKFITPSSLKIAHSSQI